LVDTNLEIKITCVDEASDAVAKASKRISDSLREVSDSQNGLVAATEQAVAPLTQEEQVQLEAAGTSLQLKIAQQDLSSAQNNLNVAIRGYGTNSVEAASALRDLNAAQANVSSLQGQVGATTKQNTASMRELTTGISGVATASFSLYGAYDRINESEISLDRSNLMVKSSTKAVEDAQRTLSTAIADHGASSQEAKSASDAFSIAQDRLALADERALQAQENVNKSIMSAALQVIPTSITMVDSLSKAWKNFPDVSALLMKISTRVADVGISAKTAAIGVAAFMGGFLVADTLLSAIPEDIRQIAGVLTASIAAIVAATINGTMTMGVAVPIILAAVGVGIAGVKAAVAMAQGGVVDKPTFALIGEAGPEIVMPLSRYEASRTESSVQTAMANAQPDIITVYVTNYIQTETDYDKASEHTIESLNESLARRRSS
jgi:hypothetical protein